LIASAVDAAGLLAERRNEKRDEHVAPNFGFANGPIIAGGSHGVCRAASSAKNPECSFGRRAADFSNARDASAEYSA
jgi:hypothetical protein